MRVRAVGRSVSVLAAVFASIAALASRHRPRPELVAEQTKRITDAEHAAAIRSLLPPP